MPVLRTLHSLTLISTYLLLDIFRNLRPFSGGSLGRDVGQQIISSILLLPTASGSLKTPISSFCFWRIQNNPEFFQVALKDIKGGHGPFQVESLTRYAHSSRFELFHNLLLLFPR
jgi:hypothetical protein